MPTLPAGIKTGHLYMVAALVLAIAGALLLRGLSGGKQAAPVKADKTTPVVVAAMPITAGDVLDRDDIKIVQWPSTLLPPEQSFTDADEVLGRPSRVDLVPGEPIFKIKLAGADSLGGLPVVIPKGMRAATVSVSEVKGVGGFLRPGDFVDVLATTETEMVQGEKPISSTQTVLQNVQILATAQTMANAAVDNIETPEGVRADSALTATAEDMNSAKGKKEKKREQANKKSAKAEEEAGDEARVVRSVTLAVWPPDAQKLILAEETGSIRLVLRPEGEDGVGDLIATSAIDLYGGMAMPAMPAPSYTSPPPAPSQTYAMARPARKSTSVELIEGTAKSTIDF
ncbi:MAG: Flp pilus assembly protein CpaB [Vampirovibrionales bacterium]|nr:Flp pilus assembly protein CpaB [Vampirovibrionales bacterium]